MFQFNGLQEVLCIAGNTPVSYNTPENNWVTTPFADLWYSDWAKSATVRTIQLDNDGFILVFAHKPKESEYVRKTAGL